MADIKVYRLPKTTDPVALAAQSKPMRIARLRSLQQDPKSFKSKYEDEIRQPSEFWLSRLTPEDCQHFVAGTSPTDESKEDVFLAFMVILSESEPKVHNIPTYKLAAFWVDPVIRGQKVGSRMLEESIQWIQQDARSKGWTHIECRLHVAPDNTRAINLYMRLGFSVVGGGSEEDDDHTEHDLFGMRMTMNLG